MRKCELVTAYLSTLRTRTLLGHLCSYYWVTMILGFLATWSFYYVIICSEYYVKNIQCYLKKVIWPLNLWKRIYLFIFHFIFRILKNMQNTVTSIQNIFSVRLLQLLKESCLTIRGTLSISSIELLLIATGSWITWMNPQVNYEEPLGSSDPRRSLTW